MSLQLLILKVKFCVRFFKYCNDLRLFLFAGSHNSYNRDHGLDVYGGAFIDDRDLYTNCTPKSRRKSPTKRRKKRQRRLSFPMATDSSADNTDRSSSPVVGQRSRKKFFVKYLSSGESDASNHGNDLLSDTEAQVKNDAARDHSHKLISESPSPSLSKTAQHKVSNGRELPNTSVPVSSDLQLECSPSLEDRLNERRGVSLDSAPADGCLEIKKRSRSLISASSEEDVEKSLKATKKKKRLMRPESDDEIRYDRPTAVVC